MSDPWTQVAGGLLTLFGVALTVWGSIRVGRNAIKRKRRQTGTATSWG